MKEEYFSSQAKEYLFGQAKKYLDQLEKRCNNMRILGMDRPRPIREIYVRVNILDKTTARKFISIDQLRNQFDWESKTSSKKDETIDGFEVINSFDKIMLLGKPGAGKSTFLKAIALQAKDRKFKEDRLPVFVSLKEFSEREKPLMEYIVEQFDYCEIINHYAFVEQALLAGNLQILLDGLDEVSIDKLDDTRRAIEAFCEKYIYNQFIISCRVAASDYIFEQFTEVQIADFTHEQIENFIDNWFQKKEQLAKECFVKLQNHKGLQELSKIPLLLALTCITYEEYLDFPANRTDLYEKSIDALLKRWDNTKGVNRREIYKGLNSQSIGALLGYIAYHNFLEGKYYVHKSELVNRIAEYIRNNIDLEENSSLDGEIILNAIIVQHGLFVPRISDFYSFSHLSFQEYFVAKYIVESLTFKEQQDLIKEIFFESPLDIHKWREVVFICLEIHPNVNEFLLSIKTYIEKFARKKKLAKWLNKIDFIVKESSYIRDWRGRVFCILLISSLSKDSNFDGVKSCAYKFAIDIDREITNKISKHPNIWLLFDIKRVIDLSINYAMDRNHSIIRFIIDLFRKYRKFGFDRRQAINLGIKLGNVLISHHHHTRVWEPKLFNDLKQYKMEGVNKEHISKYINEALCRYIENYINQYIASLALSESYKHDLQDYLIFNQFLFECTKNKFRATIMTNRKIRNKLLTVPKRWWEFWKKT